ncbi:hypothetical protein [Undibacterium pigrum]|uniref:Uncharacterized protein n=1 Tax=Undibacterium pigrum TaxID=401470 RepID=A0A318JUM7_9BURK|nr:hypothetical protein [Undibacterium pigrum]PXX44188.1 hypothetical protein DFR42_103457 [Undibacterium pigrum]
MKRHYHYVGPTEIAEAVASIPEGTAILKVQDVLNWIKETKQYIDRYNSIIATFIIDQSGVLYLADRHSEHVACARGKPVLSAGEISLLIERNDIIVDSVTNQSTGYCPEPSSWLEVANALGNAGIAAPENFSISYEFRRCKNCHSINLVKDNVFQCVLCETDLPAFWNFAH